MTYSEAISLAKDHVTILGFIGTAVTVLIAINTFQRNERWKRAEFLAKEMKEFIDKKRVQLTLTMIDWGLRTLALLHEHEANKGQVLVSRRLQVTALLPHTLDESVRHEVVKYASDSANTSCFSEAEAAIRDCYDTFLDGLERFSSYVQSGLIDVTELRPYLEYWIEDIHKAKENPDDVAWNAALLTYTHFYRFSGVQALFDAFGKDIKPTSAAYRGFLQGMQDQQLAAQLAMSVKLAYP